MLDLVGVKEEGAGRVEEPTLLVSPNPCKGKAVFQFKTTNRTPYELALFSS
ncbi:MAG: hypothetical protein ACUVUD_05170 [bacterium]